MKAEGLTKKSKCEFNIERIKAFNEDKKRSIWGEKERLQDKIWTRPITLIIRLRVNKNNTVCAVVRLVGGKHKNHTLHFDQHWRQLGIDGVSVNALVKQFGCDSSQKIK